jgi:hypothetical protein
VVERVTDSAPVLREPTPYVELNSVLQYLVTGVHATLEKKLIGAYLQGSFAVGDFSEYSDCDFLVVTHGDLAAHELQALQALHARIHELPYAYWHTNLEGSYAPSEILRRWSTTPRDPPGEPRPDNWADPGLLGSPPLVYPFWYLDHGAKTLVRSEHDNTQVVRWCLRERGVVLTGPAPHELVDPVPAGALRTEVRQTMVRSVATGLPMPMVAWQAFWVGLFCRGLHTLETGEVASKKVAMSWAQNALSPAWRGLIERAQALRKGDDAQSAIPADPLEMAATHEFAAYCLLYADEIEIQAESPL